MPNKDELFWKILDTALKLEITKGHLRWKMTDLSRASGVTRSLIYYYFGQSKESIIQAAVDIIGDELFGLSEARQALWNQGRISESIRKTRELLKGTPQIPIFYLNQRQPGSPYYKDISKLEKRYTQKLAVFFPRAKPETLQALLGSIFGLVTIVDLSDEALKKYIAAIMKLLNESAPA